MTISSVLSKQEWVGNGTTDTFSITYPFYATDGSLLFPDIQVYLRVTATGAETLQTYTTHYTITGFTGSSDGGLHGVGVVDFVTPPATTEEVHVRRVTDKTQLLEFQSGGSFPAQKHEAGLDRASMRSIEQAAEIDLTLKLPITDTSPTVIGNSVDRANKQLAFDSDGDIVLSGSTIPAGVSSFMEPVLTAATATKSKSLLEFVDRNLLVNPHGQIQQRTPGAAVANDLQYGADAWKLIAEFNGSHLLSGLQDVRGSSMRLFSGAGTTRGAMCQILDSKATEQIVASGGCEIAFSYYDENTGGDAAAQDFYLLKYVGTADTVGLDPVLTWATPNWSTDWSEVTSSLSLTIPPLMMTRFEITVTSGLTDATNLAVVFGRMNDTANKRSVVSVFDPVVVPLGASTYSRMRPFAEDLQECQKLYWKTFPYLTVPDDDEGLAGALHTQANGAFGAHAGADNWVFSIRNPVNMLEGSTPVYTVYNPTLEVTHSLAGEVLNVAHAPGVGRSTDATISNQTEVGCRIIPGTQVAVDDDDLMALHLTVEVAL
jgi:hypothetical protein